MCQSEYNQNNQDLIANSSSFGVDIQVTIITYYLDNTKYKWQSQNGNPSYT